MKTALKFLVVLWLWLLGAASASALPFSSLYVFGDSLSDTGASDSSVLSLYKLMNQCSAFHNCPPYADARFSNGRTAAEYLAAAILPGGVTPSNFQSYAIGGATTGIGNIADNGSTTSVGSQGAPGMAAQLALYQSTLGTAGKADPNALYFIWGGANDFIAQGSPIAAAGNIAGYVGMLAAAGATHIMVPNLPDLSQTPRFLDPDLRTPESAMLQGLAAQFSAAFNATLPGLLDAVELATGADIITVDTYSVLASIPLGTHNPGFTNKSDTCLNWSVTGEALICGTPDAYVFWDYEHPTTAAHALLGSAFAAALIPEPGTSALLALSLLALPLASRKHARAQRQPG
ncbi:SGNH/GDSL hydrolase family protein [Rhodocyclus purpureus]|uniref:SGNH/GDSL hydrolase family protein n=1 Tax=Rhodocyclus purpureus TaxID=1067 RepID=UPI001914770B|nr:SGNH/GDSL hydrolase family protein [Rhodocyclus purpureus]